MALMTVMMTMIRMTSSRSGEVDGGTGRKIRTIMKEPTVTNQVDLGGIDGPKTRMAMINPGPRGGISGKKPPIRSRIVRTLVIIGPSGKVRISRKAEGDVI